MLVIETHVGRGLGAHASSVLIVTISGHINDNRGTSMELIGTLEACAPRPKPFSSGDANMHLRFEGAALTSNAQPAYLCIRVWAIAPPRT